MFLTIIHDINRSNRREKITLRKPLLSLQVSSLALEPCSVYTVTECGKRTVRKAHAIHTNTCTPASIFQTNYSFH